MTTPNLRAAAQAALDAMQPLLALHEAEITGRFVAEAAWWKDYRTAIDKLRAALAQPEPTTEPVACLWQHSETGRTRVVMPDQVVDTDARWFLIGPLYLAAPPQRKPLTEEEIDALPDTDDEGSDWQALVQFARLIERAHGIGE